MADVFISYSQRDRSLASDLANFLESCGYDVWWDYDLVGGVKFRNEIKKQLALARAVIVIWTESSVESEFVIDEAEDAKQAKKLLPTRDPGLSFKFVPLGFRQLQTDPVDKPDLILRSLEEFGVRPSNPPVAHKPGTVTIGSATVDPVNVANAEQFAAWEFIKDSKNAADFTAYAARFPESPLAELARTRLASFEEQAWAALSASGSDDPSRLRAFTEMYPGSKYLSAAQTRLYGLERAAWGYLDKKDARALEAHLKTFPNGFSSGEAQSRLDEMRRGVEEQRAWKTVEAAPTRDALEAFVKAFPLSARADTARRMLAPVIEAERRAARWAIIKEQSFSEQLRNFIDEFKTGPEVVEAQERLAKRMVEVEAADWEKVRASDRPVELVRFLAKHPDGAHLDEAMALLKGLPARAEAEAWEVAKAAGGLALVGFRTAYPASRYLEALRTSAEPSGIPAAGEREQLAGAAASQAATSEARNLPVRWVLSVAVFSAGAALVLLMMANIYSALLYVNGAQITLLTAIGLGGTFLMGYALYRVLRSLLFRRGWSIGLSQNIAHACSFLPACMWMLFVANEFRGRYRAGGARGNMAPSDLQNFSGAAIALMVVIFVLLAGGAVMSGRWKFGRAIYPGTIGIIGAGLFLFGLGLVAANPIPTDHYFTRAVLMYGSLFAGLNALWFYVARAREELAASRAQKQNAEAGLSSPASA